MKSDKIIVVKMGGVVLNSSDTTVQDIIELQRRNIPLVVVHGGGNMVTEWLKRQGVTTKFVRGERVTDKETLAVAVAVLAGLANKQFVAVINRSGGRAIGLSGVDGGLVQAKVKNKEMGYVGSISKVNPEPLKAIIQAGFVPIVAPIGLNIEPEDELLLNINGDPVAGEIAAALGAERLILLTDVAGICDRDGKVLTKLTSGEAEALIRSGVASGGMIPKINACLRALSGSAAACIIDGRQPHALLKEIEGQAGGTRIFR